MEEKGNKKVEIVAFDDMQQLTAFVCGTLHGDATDPINLPRKSPACLPKVSFLYG